MTNFFDEKDEQSDTKIMNKYDTLFWLYFALMSIFGVLWINHVTNVWFGYTGYYTLPEPLMWLIVFVGWIVPCIFLNRTISYYKVIKFGVKSTWRN